MSPPLLSLLALLACGKTDGVDSAVDRGADSDGDGLPDSEELRLGTDPESADSDGDGVDDGQEVEDGTNPLYAPSRRYPEGDYAVGDCPEPPDEAEAGPTGEVVLGSGAATQRWTAYQEGDLVEALVLQDRFGQDVELRSFCGRTVLLALGAVWCEPCQELAVELAEHQASYGDAGFSGIEVILEDSGGDTPDAALLGEWEASFGLHGVPVLAPITAPLDVEPFEQDGALPTSLILGPDMRVLAVDGEGQDPGPYL